MTTWDDAIEDAKEELGYDTDGYLSRSDWLEVVETATFNLESERGFEYEESVLFYNEYINSDVWRLKRSQRLLMDRHRCFDCGKKAEHVHHLTYARLGNEPLDDLLSLCSVCHKQRHRGKMQTRLIS